MRDRHHRGFTLIELLVVIAIIALLAAIMFPVFTAVRERGRRTVCTSNVKQISAAFLMYQEMYDENFPTYSRLRGPGAGGCFYVCHWSPKLKPFLKSMTMGEAAKTDSKAGSTVFYCPSEENTKSGSYSMNLNLGYKVVNPNLSFRLVDNFLPVSLFDVKTPSRTVMVFDTPVPKDSFGEPDWWGTNWENWKTGGEGALNEDWPTDSKAPVNNFFLRPRHQGGNIVSFVDGHVRWVKRISQVTPHGPAHTVSSKPGQPPPLTGDEGFRLDE